MHRKLVITPTPPVKPPTPGMCVPQYGNPILPLTGSKQDFVELASVPGLPVRLSYDTRRKAASNVADAEYPYRAPASFGLLWETSIHRSLLVQSFGTTRVHVARGLGAWVTFTSNGAGGYTTDADIKDQLLAVAGGWRYVDVAAQAIESYDAAGRLTGIASASGTQLAFTYSDANTPPSVAPAAGLLIKVQDQLGRSRQFIYEQPATAGLAPRITRVIDPGNRLTDFAYDASGNLSRITWPDLTVRQYLYENASLPWALTGVVDENNIRLATYAYDAAGRAIDTQLAGGVNHYSATWGTAPGLQVTRTYDSANDAIVRNYAWVTPQNTVVNLPNGQSTTLAASTVQGVPRMTTMTQPAGSGCAASSSTQVLDANGNVAQRDDFNGNRVCFGHDLGRNLETVRVEGLANTATCSSLIPQGAALPVGGRKVSTQWHPDWRLATKVAQPLQMTTNVYNGQPDPFNGGAIASCAPAGAVLPDGKPIAVLCKRVEQATTDLDGSLGFATMLESGVANRVWQYTYNSAGQMLTSKDPLNNTTSYTYYTDTTTDHTQGDLQQVQNALGHLTRYTKYDASGKVLQSLDANNVATDYTYDARQRLKTLSVGGLSSTHDYWPSGQIKQVTQADQSYVAYEYDDAQRLRAMKDNLGNRIEYTLDTAGNRTAEVVKDPNGALRRQVSRSYDALGRVQQTVGRE